MAPKRNIRSTIIVLGILAAVIAFVISCDKLQFDHPQAAMADNDSRALTEEHITAYGDSIDANLAQFTKQQSLVYERGDYSFSVARYSKDNAPVLYVERGSAGESGDSEKRYYLKDGKVVLYSERTSGPAAAPAASLVKLYYRNSVLFNGFIKKGSSETELEQARFQPYRGGGRKAADQDLPRLEDAVSQKGEFDLVFESVTEYPRARYIVLTRERFNAYRAVIRADKEDEFIRELASNPMKYQGASLHIKWNVTADNEAVYKEGTLKPVLP
ncbi:hypothetical protein [Arcticibacter sp. MXS-1]|uniref:hypothetical protein n=1 Tax=Arcticibacter sp. MXS-1 TaxID=3341726 RepID=UPI0035A89F9A